MEDKIEIKYHRAKLTHRVLANLIDILIFALFFFVFFISVRAIITGSEDYKAKVAQINQTRLDSGLYIEKSGTVTDIVSYLNSDASFSSSYRKDQAVKAINNCMDYFLTDAGAECFAEAWANYEEYRLQPAFSYDGEYLFVKQDGVVIENPKCKASYQMYYESVYAPYIDESMNGYLIKFFPTYYQNLYYVSRIVVYIEIPVSVAISGLLVYVIPPFIFRRGRKTLGKLLYRIGLVDSRLLNVTWKREIARVCIVFFGEVLLSLVTFGIPIIISFSLMVFSKNKQSFPDYMLGLHEIDTSSNNIYYSKDEITLDNIKQNKEPVNFRLPSNR